MSRTIKTQSLRRKLTLVALVTILAVQVCAAIVLIGLDRTRAKRSLIGSLQTQSRIVVDNLAAALLFDDRDAAQETLRSLRVNDGFERACLYDVNGALFASERATRPCLESATAEAEAALASGAVVSTPVLAPARVAIGTLMLQSSLQPVNDAMREQIAGTLVVLLVSALTAVVLMARLLRVLTRPLAQLADTAAAVSRDRDYSRRVSKEYDDEVGAVAGAVNDMLSQIQARDEELQTALRLKDEFLATVSHELRTPLNAMLGWSHVLRTEPQTSAIAKQAVDAIDRNTRMQARLIDDILDVSRIITGKMRLDPVKTDLVTIVQSAVDVVLPSAQAKRITIDSALPVSAPFVGDPDRLRQVVWNLLSNAVKFTPQEGLVRVSLAETGDEYRIEVSDTGRGVAPDFLPYIFQAFRQADGSSTRRQGGLGLGLAIARHLTELSGGSIHAASHGLNLGSTFSISLPRRDGVAVEPVMDDGATPPVQAVDLDGCRVLVVDDNEDTRSVLGMMLAGNGARVSTAASVAEARVVLASSAFDVIVTDLAMPAEDGFQLLDYCRRHPDVRLRALPVVALTASAGAQVEARVLAAGFDAYLAKPAEPAQVAKLIRDVRYSSDLKGASLPPL